MIRIFFLISLLSINPATSRAENVRITGGDLSTYDMLINCASVYSYVVEMAGNKDVYKKFIRTTFARELYDGKTGLGDKLIGRAHATAYHGLYSTALMDLGVDILELNDPEHLEQLIINQAKSIHFFTDQVYPSFGGSGSTAFVDLANFVRIDSTCYDLAFKGVAHIGDHDTRKYLTGSEKAFLKLKLRLAANETENLFTVVP